MAHRWRYEDSAGHPVAGPDLEFDDAAEAEAWFSDSWEELAGAGVHQVVLLDGDTKVYGPMGLDPA
ncbi:hypothetical protein [Rhodococcus sp. X156]|uniref:hypothetical protein n=1 Tax=Rhodococcus sp. X156 TaxID=2499145 RepID=UPI000FDC2E09|nr:hypothetical protein [Rhodococcus sp. X156]